MKIKPKILIVDDDPLIQSMTRSALQRVQFHGFKLELIHALSAEEGRKLYLANPDIAVILLDVAMEYETAGLDFYQWVRERNHASVRNQGPTDPPHFDQPIILRTSQTGSFGRNAEHPDHYPITEFREKMELANPKRLQNVLISNLITFHLQEMCAQLVDCDQRSGWEILTEVGLETGSYYFSEPLDKVFQQKWFLSLEAARILALSINTLRRLRAAADDKVFDTETKPSPVLILEEEAGLGFLSSFQRDHPRRELVEAETKPIDLDYQAQLKKAGWSFQPWWSFDAPQADLGDYTKWCVLSRLPA